MCWLLLFHRTLALFHNSFGLVIITLLNHAPPRCLDTLFKIHSISPIFPLHFNNGYRYSGLSTHLFWSISMASSKREKIKLKSSKSAYIYTSEKNKSSTPERITLKKYDPTIRQRCEFKEAK
jgi:large subunit ribosomal protein L33